MTIICAKLYSGEEVVARKTNQPTAEYEPSELGPKYQGSTNMTFKTEYSGVMVALLRPLENGKLHCALVPYVMMKPDIIFTEEQWRKMAIQEYKADSEIRDMYTRATSSLHIP